MFLLLLVVSALLLTRMRLQSLTSLTEPNEKKKPGLFQKTMSLHQLRCGGVLETVMRAPVCSAACHSVRASVYANKISRFLLSFRCESRRRDSPLDGRFKSFVIAIAFWRRCCTISIRRTGRRVRQRSFVRLGSKRTSTRWDRPKFFCARDWWRCLRNC